MYFLQTEFFHLLSFWSWSTLMHRKAICSGIAACLHAYMYIIFNFQEHYIECPYMKNLIIQMSSKVLFSRLFQMFNISLPENYELVAIMSVVLEPKGDVCCTLESRKK